MGNNGSRDRQQTVQFANLDGADEQPLLRSGRLTSKSVNMVLHPLVKTSI